MEKQFAASEVHRLSNRIPRSNDEIADAQEALRAFADMLEAQEKAVPFGYAYRYWDCIRFDTGGREINGSKPTATIPLYTHPPHPSSPIRRGAVGGSVARTCGRMRRT